MPEEADDDPNTQTMHLVQAMTSPTSAAQLYTHKVFNLVYSIVFKISTYV